MKMSHVLLCVLVLTACAPAVEWWRPDDDLARFPGDRYTCLREATYTGGFPMPILSPAGTMLGAIPFPTQEVDQKLFVMCMELRGWHLRPKLSSR